MRKDVSATKPLQSLHILLVEDSEAMARNMAFFLRHAGAQVETVASMSSAKHRLQKIPAPDIALLDYRLAGAMSGTDLALWAREQQHLRCMLRVSFSSAPPEKVLAKAPAEGVYHAVLQKPMRLEKLASELAEIAEKLSQRPSAS